MTTSYVPCNCGYHHVRADQVMRLSSKKVLNLNYHPVCYAFAVALRNIVEK